MSRSSTTRLAKFSTFPASNSPGRNLTDPREIRGAREPSPRSRFKNVTAGHCGGVTSRMPIDASKSLVLLEGPVQQIKGGRRCAKSFHDRGARADCYGCYEKAVATVILLDEATNDVAAI